MRIRRQEGYLLQKIGNTHYLLPYGQKIADQQRGMELNETARILWEALETPKTMEELQQKMIRCYEVPEEEQEELKKDIQAFVKELLAFGAVRRELGSPDGTCAGELKIAGISIAVYGKEGCIPKQFASFEKKRGKEEATEKTEGEAAKKTGEKEVEETVIKTENRQDAADLTLELIEHVPESHQNGNILIRNKDLTVCAWEEGYVLWFPALKNIYEIWMKADGSFCLTFITGSAYDRRRAGFPLSGDPAGISVPGTEKRHVCAAFRISSLSGKSMAVFRSVGNGKIDSYGTLEKTV